MRAENSSLFFEKSKNDLEKLYILSSRGTRHHLFHQLCHLSIDVGSNMTINSGEYVIDEVDILVLDKIQIQIQMR